MEISDRDPNPVRGLVGIMIPDRICCTSARPRGRGSGAGEAGPAWSRRPPGSPGGGPL